MYVDILRMTLVSEINPIATRKPFSFKANTRLPISKGGSQENKFEQVEGGGVGPM